MKKIFLFSILMLIVGMFTKETSADLSAMKARIPELVKAKEAGKIGEQGDGLVGFVSGEDASLSKLVAEENADRMKIYKERASQQNQELGVFMKVMGEARVEGEKKGRFVKTNDGAWKKK